MPGTYHLSRFVRSLLLVLGLVVVSSALITVFGSAQQAFAHPSGGCASAELRRPIDGYKVGNRDFGEHKHPIYGDMRMHNGVDVAAPEGTPVLAVADAKVVTAGYNGGAGNMVTIQTGNGCKYVAMHLSSMDVRVGESVSRGQRIGAVGTTGASTGNHLHFEARTPNGAAIDPIAIFAPEAPAPAPAPEPAPAPAAPPASAPAVELVSHTTPAPADGTHTVVPGDWLSKIADAHSINPWQTLYEFNREVIGPNPDLIEPGMVLRLNGQPAPAPAPAPAPEAPAAPPTHVPVPAASDLTYTIASGDTLGTIAMAHGVTWQPLYALNRDAIGPDPDRVEPGTVLRLPVGATPAPAMVRLSASTPETAPAPDPAASNSSAGSLGERIAAEARRHVGKPYSFGAAGPNAFDCSGLTSYVYRQHGIELPRTSTEQARASGTRIGSPSDLRPGDLVLSSYGRKGRGVVDHVGIYVGDGQVVAASNPSKGVTLQSLHRGAFVAGLRVTG